MKNKKFFLENLIKWDRIQNKRQMPWKGERDPYKIWISEIILQQTRVSQGLDYYNRFVKKWPDIKSLASASEVEVFKAWEGLGYYSRCRNLIETSKYLQNEYGGRFPSRFDEILKLKGIGNYTASAIASFAYNQPYAVLDGNVFRVLARFFGIYLPVDSSEGKFFFNDLAGSLLDKKNPGIYNQAIMDFGAVICKPAQPLCENCPLKIKCGAFHDKSVEMLPVKRKRVKQTNRFFEYLIINKDQKFYVRQRMEKDIWQNLFEFVLIETERLKSEKEIMNSREFKFIFKKRKIRIEKISESFSQKLTHQIVTGRFWHIKLSKEDYSLEGYHAVTKKEMVMLPFPKFVNSYLKDKNVSVNLL
jgi:A/G-specific adenine glycosylase